MTKDLSPLDKLFIEMDTVKLKLNEAEKAGDKELQLMLAAQYVQLMKQLRTVQK